MVSQHSKEALALHTETFECRPDNKRRILALKGERQARHQRHRARESASIIRCGRGALGQPHYPQYAGRQSAGGNSRACWLWGGQHRPDGCLRTGGDCCECPHGERRVCCRLAASTVAKTAIFRLVATNLHVQLEVKKKKRTREIQFSLHGIAWRRSENGFVN